MNNEQMTVEETQNTTGTEEIENLRMENERLRSAVRVRDARDQLVSTLRGTQSPELLFEAAKEMLQFDDDGKLVNGAAIISELERRYPEQFHVRQVSIGGGAGRQNEIPFFTKESLAQMKPEEIKELDWNTVKQVLRDG